MTHTGPIPPSPDRGVLSGLRVVDLGRGIAGAMTTMLLADYGADVVRVDSPGGVPAERTSGYVVWDRGKRRVTLDLTRDDDRARLYDLVARCDVVVESLRPGVTERLGVSYEELRAVNPRVVHASISGYGRGTPDEQRPGIEWLVTARAGLQWDQRGWYGTRTDHIMGTDLAESEFPVPPGAEQTGCREGPIYLAVPWASIGAATLAVTGISAGVLVQQRTGRGQHFETSLVQAAIMENAMGWQRVDTMHPSYRLWYFDRRAPKGIFQAADGKWLHQFAPIDHDFIRAAALGEHTSAAAPPRLRSGGYEDAVRFQVEAHPETAAAIATAPRDEWIRRLHAAGRAAQPILSPEEGLADEVLAGEGVITVVDDPEHGPIRQFGHGYHFEKVPNPPIRPRASAVADPASIMDEWDADRGATPAVSASAPLPDAPLAGVTVLDFGLAIAGPYGPQVLADLGATVIKVTSLDFDLTDAIYVGSSRGKLGVAVDLKRPEGLEVARRLIARADVVHHNMRTGVAERLGIGYEQAREVNPAVIYCHTRGFELDGPRTSLPGNDQMGHALAGTAYEAGGTHHGTPPIWHMIGFGDAATGILSANAVVQALMHRDRTGEGQFVHASIVNTALFFNSSTYTDADGVGPERARIDAGQYGFCALRRLYETAEGWICIHVRDEADWRALERAAGLVADPRFADASARAEHDAALAAALAERFAAGTAGHWWQVLDDAGVPCEIASSTFARELFDDPDCHRRGWVVATEHAHLHRVEQVGPPWTFSLTDAMNRSGSPITGQHTRAVLGDLGYSDAEIAALVADGVVGIADAGDDAGGDAVVGPVTVPEEVRA